MPAATEKLVATLLTTVSGEDDSRAHSTKKAMGTEKPYGNKLLSSFIKPTESVVQDQNLLAKSNCASKCLFLTISSRLRPALLDMDEGQLNT